jgi:pilus assembly protein Flp/PilA
MNYTATKMIARLQAFWATREQGATAVEYALMVALIAVAIIVAVTALGSTISAKFNGVSSSVSTAN